MMTIFDEFADAREDGWMLGEVERATEIGTVFSKVADLHPIVSDADTADFNKSPNQDIVVYDLLIYVEPSEMPTTDISLIVAKYVVRSPEGRFYNITQAATGRNQQEGVIEHLELKLAITSVEENEDE